MKGEEAGYHHQWVLSAEMVGPARGTARILRAGWHRLLRIDTGREYLFAMVFTPIRTGFALVPHVADAILLEHDRRATSMMHHGHTALRARERFFKERGFLVVEK